MRKHSRILRYSVIQRLYQRVFYSIIGLILLSPQLVVGAANTDLSYLYDPVALQQWQRRIEADLRWNFDTALMGSLTARERANLGQVRLVLPLLGSGKARGYPLAFAASNREVIMPIMSLRFLTDIAIASAYLVENGYTLETVSDYALILKHQVFTGKLKALPPLKALQIPDDALDKRWVKDTAQKIQKSALVWIMAHEIGHIYHNHPPGYGAGVPRDQAQANEIEADRFANDLMRRVGIPPLGMANVFMVLAHLSLDRSDFTSDDDWRHFQRFEATHPLTAKRMTLMADDIVSDPGTFLWKEPHPSAVVPVLHDSARQIRDIGKILESPDMQRFIAMKSQSLTWDSLRPRK